MPQTLFRSETLLVRAFLGRGSALCVVAFDPMANDRSLDREAFAEEFFAGREVDAIHVISAHNAWYQDPGLPAALAAVRAITCLYGSVAAYGSSMGGYAALRFSDWVGADVAVAISPQYSMQGPFAGVERRWMHLRRSLTWLFEQPGQALPAIGTAIVFYDDRGLDRAHAEAIGRDLPHAALVKVPYGGHPAGAMLSETGILSSAILEALQGRVDPASVLTALRRERHRSGQYFFTLARKQPISRLRLKARLATRAVAASPLSAVYRSYAGVVASSRGEAEESLRLHRAAQGHLEFPDCKVRFAVALLRASDWEAACRTAAQAMRGFPSSGTSAPVRLLAYLEPNATGVSLAELLALRRDPTLPDRWPFLLAAFFTRAHRLGLPGSRALSLRLLRHIVRRRWFRYRELRSADGEERRQPVGGLVSPVWRPFVTRRAARGLRPDGTR